MANPFDDEKLVLGVFDEHVEKLRNLLKTTVFQRDLAVAHDTQPYPTAEAYELVCKRRNELQAEVDAHRAGGCKVSATRRETFEEIIAFMRDNWPAFHSTTAERSLRDYFKETSK